MKRIVCLILALAALVCLAVPAAAAEDSVLAAALSHEPASLDPALIDSADGVTVLSHMFSGLARWALDEDGQPTVVADCATRLVKAQANEDGTVTYTYTLRSGLKWSDGEAVTAADFAYGWKRALSIGGGYSYLFLPIVGYSDGWLDVTAVDETTLQVHLAYDVPFWNELLTLPCFYPLRQAVAEENPDWFYDPATYICNGPFKLQRWSANGDIVLEKNMRYHGAKDVALDGIEFSFPSQDSALSAFDGGSLHFAALSGGDLAAIQADHGDEFQTAQRLGVSFLCWNANEEILPDSFLNPVSASEEEPAVPPTAAEAEKARADIRGALWLLLDGDDLCQLSGQTPAASLVPAGMTETDGKSFSEGADYFDISAEAAEANREAALKILKKYYDYDTSDQLVDFPVLTYLYASGADNKAMAQAVQSALGQVGITVNLENQIDSAYRRTLQAGDFSIAQCSVDAAYSDPQSLLERFTSGSGRNWAQLGKGAHGERGAYDLDLTRYGSETVVEDGSWSGTYDAVISAVRHSSGGTRFKLLHLAEDMLMDTGCILPVSCPTDGYLLSGDVEGFFTVPTGVRSFVSCTLG